MSRSIDWQQVSQWEIAMGKETQPPLEKPSDRELLETILSIPGSTGDTYRRFHNYSQRNLGFLAIQGCAPEPVATYGRWQELGRQVRKGEKAYSILRPINIRLEDENDPLAEQKMIRRFKVVRALFAYSQTEGDALPTYVHPAWDVDRALTSLNIQRIPFEQYNGNIGGYAIGRSIAINPMAPHPMKTTFHEISHVDLGHTQKDYSEYEAHRGVMEVEAEMTGHLALKELDMLDHAADTLSRGYMQSWLRNNELPDASIRSILTSSTRVIQAGLEDGKE